MNTEEFLKALENGDTNKLENDNTAACQNSKGDVSEYFDHVKEHADEIFPLMQQLSTACKKYGLPHMFWVMSANSAERTSYSMIADVSHPAARKMAVLANIADGTIELEEFAKVCIAALLSGKFNL